MSEIWGSSKVKIFILMIKKRARLETWYKFGMNSNNVKYFFVIDTPLKFA